MSKRIWCSKAFLLASVTAGILRLCVPQAQAAEEQSAVKAKEKAARTACLAGDPAKGVALLAELFVDTNDFNYIFNQARCFEQNHRYEDAISRFREFLKKAPNLPSSDRADVETQIAECQRFLQPEAAPSPKAAPEAAVAPQPASAAPVATVVEAPPPHAAGSSPGSGLRATGIVCGVLGLASIGTGVYFYTRAVSLSDKVSTSDAPSPSDHKAGKNAQTMQWIFYGAGAGVVATGAVLYYLGWRDGDAAKTTAIAPLVGPGIAGLSAQGAF